MSERPNPARPNPSSPGSAPAGQPDPLLTPSEAARYLKVSERALENWR